MVFCSSCGAALPDYAKYCSACGESLAPFIPSPEVLAKDAVSDALPPPSLGYMPELPYDREADIAENKALSILCYLGPLVMVSVFLMKNSKYVRFHANEGMLLLIIDIAGSILCGIAESMLDFTSAYFIAPLLWTLYWITLVVFLLIGVVNAASGRENPLPVFGRFMFLK